MGSSTASESFTEALLHAIRVQRHKNVRVVVSTQEPTISPKLLELCSFTLVHRFTSPAWLTALRAHLTGASEAGKEEDDGGRDLMKRIVALRTGEALLFSPTAMLTIQNGKPVRLDTDIVKFKTRMRLSADGGTSHMAI